jgi:Tfp pilus assembly protein PilW
MVIAMVLLGGLLLSFTQQNSEYKYQNKRGDAVQDLEFTINFIAHDLRNALAVGSPAATDITITPGGAGAGIYSDTVDIRVWEEDAGFWTGGAAVQQGNNYQAIRRYDYDQANESLRYDRNTVPGGASVTEILPNVTDFRVFQDVAGSQPEITAGTPFPGSPVGLQDLTVLDANANNVTLPGYTVLIEIAIDTGYKQGLFINARGVDVRTLETPARKRVWRYVQVHPRSVAE